MPVISQLILTNQLPINTYSASVMTSGSLISDGLGNQLTFLQITASNAVSTSFFSTPVASITNAGNVTGSVSSSGFGFSSAAQFNTFINSVSSSLQSYNTLLNALRVAGIIT